MTISAQGNQVFLSILSRLTAESLMMDFEVCHGTAALASPGVTA